MRILYFLGILLLASTIAQGQFDPDIFREKAEDYLASNPREKLLIHTSKPQYLTGETIWYRIFHYNEINHLSFSFSKVVYIDLIDNAGEVVAKQKIRIDEKGGDGSIFLPTELNSGQYTLRAYTLWMRNFEDVFFASVSIEILNPFKRLNLTSSIKIFNLNLFPEGGSLVQGLNSVIAFKADDGHGLGVDFNGYILNEANDTITRFSPDKFGMGRFNFKPSANDTYRVIAINDELISRHDFPMVQQRGYVMTANLSNGKYNVEVKTNSDNHRIHLAMISRDRFMFIKSQNMVNGGCEFQLNDKELNEGVNQLTVFDERGTPVAERLIFKYPDQKLDIEVEFDDVGRSIREKVQLNVSTNVNGSPSSSDVSISVYRSAPGLQRSHAGIESEMWLSSELQGVIESPDYYFTNRPASSIHLDNLLMTQGWRVYDVNFENSHQFFPEFIDQTVSGKIVNKITNEPIINEKVYFSFSNNYTQLFISKSDSLGNIFFETKDIYGTSEVYLRSESMDSIDVEISLSDSYHPISQVTLPLFDPSPEYEEELISQVVNMQIENHFGEPVSSFRIGDTTSFYRKPASTYYLDDYTRFPVMEEVMREYVFGVYVRKENGLFVFKVIDEIRNEVMEVQPLVLLDGVPVFDTEMIMAIDPLNIERIEVIRSRYYYGYENLNGVVAFYSYDTDLPGFSASQQAIILDYQGFQKGKKFYSPSYDTQGKLQNRLPDFRNTLFWAPRVSTDDLGQASLEFYTSDATGQFTIEVKGLGPKGEPGSFKTTFEVGLNSIKD